MALLQLSERAVLDYVFGNAIGQMNQTITAPAATTTSLTVRGTSGAGGLDLAIPANGIFLVGTPGSAGTQNQYSNVDVFTSTAGAAAAATSIVIPSQTVGKSRAAGDFIFLLGTTAGFTPAFFTNTWYVGLTTQLTSGATSANILSAEPTATGSYARVAVLNNVANFTAATASNPASKTTGTAITYPASTAAWSTGATTLKAFFIADASTLAGGNVLCIGDLTTPQAVNASGITPSFAIGQLTATLV